MYYIYNVDTKTYIMPVDHIPARDLNRFIRQYPHLEVRKVR